jgi:hypothetical protein
MFFLLMALSPVAFVGSFIPKIGEYSKKWWDNLINQTLVGPVFMFLMLVTIRLIGPLSQFTLAGTITADRSSGINNSASVFGLILNTAIIVGFIIATVKITKKFSGEAGAFLSKAAGGLAGALTVGAGGMLLRNTIGRGAALLVNNEKVKNIATRMPGGGLALKGISNVSKASFDVRNTALGKTLDKQGLNLGKAGGADGFQGQVKRYSDMAVEKSKLMKIDTDSNSGNKIVNKILNEEVMPKAQKEAKLKEKIDTSNQTFEDNKKGIEVEIDAIKAEHKAASDALINETDPGKKANLQTQQTDAIARIKAKEKEISDNEKARKLKAEEVERLGLTKQEEKDSENIIIRGAKLEELRAKAKKDAESLNQNTYADNMKKAVLPHIIGGKKGARDLAAQIRKTAGGKSANDLVVEQMKKEQAEKDKAAAATNPTPSTP